MDLGASLLGLVIALIVKVAVMVWAGRLLLRLYGALRPASPRRLWLLLPKDDLPWIKLLWWSLVCFAASELTCGVEIYILLRSSPVLACFHGLASAVGMGLFAMGACLFLDQTFLRYGGSACLINRLCKGCTYAAPEGCRYRTTLLLLGTFLALACLPPLWAPTTRMDADPRAWILPFPALNAWYDHSLVPWIKSVAPAGYDPNGTSFFLPRAQLVLEFRILPGVALAVALAGIQALRKAKDPLAFRLLAFSAGVLAYTYLELTVYRITGDILLGALAHELVEFWFLAFTADALARTFGPRTGDPSHA